MNKLTILCCNLLLLNLNLAFAQPIENLCSFSVSSFDTDPLAIEVAQIDFELNDVEKKVTLLEGSTDVLGDELDAWQN